MSAKGFSRGSAAAKAARAAAVYGSDLPPSPNPTKAHLRAERDRRLAVGFDYDFVDARGVHHIGTTPADMAAWDGEVKPLADALIALGDTTTTIAIVTDTGPVAVTALDWQRITLAAAAFRQRIYSAYFAMKDLDPIPPTYIDNDRWD